MHSYVTGLLLILSLLGCRQKPMDNPSTKQPTKPDRNEEIFYLIFPRSFYDSNGDRIGDLNGVTQQLDYIQGLGVTSVIMTPIYASSYYHNYFSNDFYAIDPEFGTMDDYLHMVKEIHRRGMKFYMDTELQYVTREHPWFSDSYKNPDSNYSDYVLYKDSLNAEPETMLYDLSGLKSYDGFYTDITMVNLKNENVVEYITDYFLFWIDPNKDGNFEDGVDGFRLDSFNDDLLGKNILTNLTGDFWKPLIDRCRLMNPDVTFIEEQASWDDGDSHTWMKTSGVDIAYSFGLRFNLTNPKILKEYFLWSENDLPEGRKMFAFLDQHDTDRIISTITNDAAKNQQLATLAYLTNMVPYVYYGQEIGMQGKNIEPESQDPEEFNDGLGIPVREPFEWTANIKDPGMALWYENVEPYWSNRHTKSNDGCSVEEQNDDPNSLLNFYRSLLKFRSSNAAMTHGNFQVLENSDDSIFGYYRWTENSGYVLVFNLGSGETSLTIETANLPFEVAADKGLVVFGDGASRMDSTADNSNIEIKLTESGYMVLQLK